MPCWTYPAITPAMPGTSPTRARRSVTPAAAAREAGGDAGDAVPFLGGGGGVTKVSAIARLPPFAHAQRGRHRLTEDPDEALGVARLVAGHVERRRARLVERVRARARDRPGRTLEQLDRDLAGRGRKRLVDERDQRGAQRREPLALVDEVRHARRELGARAQHVVREREPA